MKRYLDLVTLSAKFHKRQSRMTRVCIVLAVFLVTVIFGMADMQIQGERIQEIKNNGEWHAMFRGIDGEQAAMIAARPETESVSWYGVSNYGLDRGYAIEGIETVICGVDESFGALFSDAEIREGAFPSGPEEAALTQSAAKRLGLEIGERFELQIPEQEPLSFTVTGFVNDTSLITRRDVCGMFVNSSAYSARFLDASSGEDLIFYAKFSSRCRINRVISDIKEQLGLQEGQVQEHTVLLGLMGQSKDSYMVSFYLTALVLAVLVFGAGIMMIASSLNSNVAQRTQFFGMLGCIGAEKRQIIRMVTMEALNWCKTAIPVGLVCATGVIWAICAVLRAVSPRYFKALPVFSVSWIGICLGAAGGIVTVLFAAGSPARRAAKVSPLTAVSGNVDFTVFTEKAARARILPVEAALGVHHAKSSKKNLLLMTGSFALSIILFLAFSCSIDFMNHAIRSLRPNTPDLSVTREDGTASLPRELQEEIERIPAVKRVYGRMIAYDVPATAEGEEILVNLISYETHQFDWAKKEMLQKLPEREIGTEEMRAYVFYGKGSWIGLGGGITVNSGSGGRLTVAGILPKEPFDVKEGVYNVVCSEEDFQRIMGTSQYAVIDIQLKRFASDEDAEAVRSLLGPDMAFSDRRMENEEIRGAYYSFALFSYGFVAMIALIAVFNIVNSIAMSVSARTKQYACMRAVGMSVRQAVGMVAAETFTYIVLGIVSGSVIGLFINKLLFERLITARWGTAWYLPMGALGIIVLVVASASVLALRGPAKRIGGMSISETIK